MSVKIFVIYEQEITNNAHSQMQMLLNVTDIMYKKHSCKT